MNGVKWVKEVKEVQWVQEVKEVKEVQKVEEVKEIMGCKNAKKTNSVLIQVFWSNFFHFSFNNHLLKKILISDNQLFAIFILRTVC